MGKKGKRNRQQRRRQIGMTFGTYTHVALPHPIISALEGGLRPGFRGQHWTSWHETSNDSYLISGEIRDSENADPSHALWIAASLDLADHDKWIRTGTVLDWPFPADRRGVFLSVGETAARVSDWPDRMTINVAGQRTELGPFEEPFIPESEAAAILAA